MNKLKSLFSSLKMKMTELEVKFFDFKTKFSNSLPTFAEDVQKHFVVVYSLSLPTSLFGMFNPILGLIGLGTILAGAILWELPTLIRGKFSYVSVKESIKDVGVAFAAVMVPLVMMIYIYTTFVKV